MTVGLALLAFAATARAQDREDRWELGLGALYQLGSTIDARGGSTVDTGGGLGFVIDSGYNFTDHVAVNFGMSWAGIDYDADVVDDQGEQSRIRGSFDSFGLFGNALYYFGDGALAPYVGAGLGWTFIDTNIPNGPPVTGCWWDPWYGYVCWTNYPTKTTDAFSYQATLGLRYEFNYSTYMRFSYTSQWVDLSDASGTPRFDVLDLEFGWMF